MRDYMVKTIDYHCNVCHISEYNGKPITLQVDHIDGDRKNNTLENLQFICPNCHSQTETWGVGNMSEEGRLRCRTNLN
jgi:5-methylcytosine-specific restriction endonuclease McrA